jgi:hypothetical protein
VRKKATMVPRVCRNPAAGATMAYEAVRCGCPMSVMLPLSRGSWLAIYALTSTVSSRAGDDDDDGRQGRSTVERLWEASMRCRVCSLTMPW